MLRSAWRHKVPVWWISSTRCRALEPGRSLAELAEREWAHEPRVAPEARRLGRGSSVCRTRLPGRKRPGLPHERAQLLSATFWRVIALRLIASVAFHEGELFLVSTPSLNDLDLRRVQGDAHWASRASGRFRYATRTCRFSVVVLESA